MKKEKRRRCKLNRDIKCRGLKCPSYDECWG